MARDRTYDDLLKDLKGKKVAIWTCNTCARLCNDMGGKESMDRLVTALKNDGMEVIGTGSTSAGCMESKLRRNADFASEADVIVALTCNIGARCAEHIFKRTVLNPVRTFGSGYLTEDGTPVMMEAGSTKNIDELTGFKHKDDFPIV